MARKARRKQTRDCNKESWIGYQEATNQKKRQIKKAKTLSWRALVSEITEDRIEIWKLARRAKKSEEERGRSTLIPGFKVSENEV